MSGEKFCMRLWRGGSFKVLMLVLACFAWAACDSDDEIDSSDAPGPFQLIFSLDESFQSPHGGQQISMAVVRESDGLTVAHTNGTISATQNPSFSFNAGAVLEKRVSYAVHYWIDSNFGGGTLGVCDSKEIDHQWSVEFPSPDNDVTFTASYNADLTEDICDTFN